MTKPLSLKQLAVQAIWDKMPKPEKEISVIPYSLFYLLVFFIPYYSGAKAIKNYLGGILMSNPNMNVIMISICIAAFIVLIAIFFLDAALTLVFFKEMQGRFISQIEYYRLKKYSFLMIVIYYLAAMCWYMRDQILTDSGGINIIPVVIAIVSSLIVLPIWKVFIYKGFDFCVMKLQPGK